MNKYTTCLRNSYKFNPISNLNKILPTRCSHSISRTFFNFSDFGYKKKEYRRKELVGYSMEQMYSVVSDVSNYKHFVPYCKKSTVSNRTKTNGIAEMVVGFPPLHESYTCQLTYDQPKFVRSECTDGRLFNYLLNHWGFSAGVKDVPNSCVIDFQLTFEFKSKLHSQVSHIFFDLIVQQMEGAFLQEANRRYGNPSIKSLLLSLQKS